jgi:hypothetical protein
MKIRRGMHKVLRERGCLAEFLKISMRLSVNMSFFEAWFDGIDLIKYTRSSSCICSTKRGD